jgi:hypothetical protein
MTKDGVTCSPDGVHVQLECTVVEAWPILGPQADALVCTAPCCSSLMSIRSSRFECDEADSRLPCQGCPIFSWLMLSVLTIWIACLGQMRVGALFHLSIRSRADKDKGQSVLPTLGHIQGRCSHDNAMIPR